MNAIEIKNLSKIFRGMYAVDHLKMTVPAGSIYGFIGENGSGKTTFVNLLCGMYTPDSGKVYIGGYDVEADVTAARRTVSAVTSSASSLFRSSV